MRASCAVVSRSYGPRRTREASSSSGYGLYASVSDLVALRSAARDAAISSRGRTQRLFPARGDRPSDDDLAASGFYEFGLMGEAPPAETARVAGEAAEPPLLIVVDQRLSMFQGARGRSLKSVAAAEAAAFCLWRGLEGGAAVGGVVFNDSTIEAIEPRRGGGAAMQVVKALAAQNAELRALPSAPRSPQQLEAALRRASLVRGARVVVVSDFSGHGETTRRLLREIAAENDLHAIYVYDPFVLDLSHADGVVVSRGEVLIDLEFGDGLVRRRLFDLADAQANATLAVERELDVPVFALSAAEDTVRQMRSPAAGPRGRDGFPQA